MRDKDILITCQKDSIGGDGEDTSDVVTVYRYPYRTFPDLKSHLHPKFAIFDAGEKLKALVRKHKKSIQELRQLVDQLVCDYPAIADVQHLYNAWTQEIPDVAKEDLSYVDPSKPELASHSEDDESGDANDSNYIGRGTRGLVYGIYNHPRTRSIAATEPKDNDGHNRTNRARGDKGSQEKGNQAIKKAPVVKKRKVLSESSARNQHLLSEAVLSRYNKRFLETAWTADRIRAWSSSTKRRRLVLA